MRHQIARVVMVSAFMLLPAAAWAQAATSGIAGVARDATGAVLPGVTVEAASPALIERIRTVVTDDQGQYKIVDLRPGSYTVTFTLAGFSTVKREGLDLNAGFTATVNADLKVGSLTETITVTGASPVVDTQNVRSQSVLTRDVLDSVPIAKNAQSFANLTVGVYQTSGQSGDVGGAKGETYAGLASHGGADGMTFVDGMRTNTATNFATNSRYMHNQLSVQEVVLETGGVSAENLSGGVNINIVPKDGGNRFEGMFIGEYANSRFAADNLNDEIRARGLTKTTKLRRVHDVGIGVGGPIMRDKLWFHTAHRNWGGLEESAGAYYNKLQGTLFYEPDLSRPGFFDNYARDDNFRLTWQATSKQKISVFGGFQDWCLCPRTYEIAAEAAEGYKFFPNNLLQATWNYPASSRLLLEAGWTLRTEHHIIPKPPEAENARSVIEQTIGQYGSVWSADTLARGAYGDHGNQGQYSTRFAVSYITGSHAFKTGVTTMTGENNIGGPGVRNNHPEQYIFRSGIPVGLNQAAYPHHHVSKLKLDLGIYAQDQWTIKRLTLNLGVRFDSLNGYNPAQCRPAGDFTPEFCFEPIYNVPNWKDISPRGGVAYDVFGNGKTAIKLSLGRYVKPQATGITNGTNAAAAIAAVTTRTWDDANGNYVPDCDLRSRSSNGECGPMANQLFGTVLRQTAYAKDVTEGWHVRAYNSQASVLLQQELRPGIGLTVGYFRTWWGNGGSDSYPGSGLDNFVNDNLAVTPADFDSFCVTAPADPRLPGGGGNQVCGLYDVKPAKFGQVDNLVSDPTKFGKRTYVYNGVDAAINARFGRGGTFYGGVSLGQKDADRCASPDTPTQFCNYTVPIEGHAQYKASGSYPLFWGLQASATYVSMPGIPISASYSAPNEVIAPSLGRNLAACGNRVPCTAATSVQLIEPFTQFEDRLTKVDVRLAKNVRVGRVRMQPRVDLYNLFNSATVLGQTTTLGPAYRRPLQILGARFAKFGLQVDF